MTCREDVGLESGMMCFVTVDGDTRGGGEDCGVRMFTLGAGAGVTTSETKGGSTTLGAGVGVVGDVAGGDSSGNVGTVVGVGGGSIGSGLGGTGGNCGKPR